MKAPILSTTLENKLHRGENDFAEMCAWDANARQLRQVADLMVDLAADCVMERRKGEANEEHVYARIRAAGHYELSRELLAFANRLAQLEAQAGQQREEAHEEYELQRQAHHAQGEGR